MNTTITFTAGDLELRLYPALEGWRVSTTIEPADPQYNDFASRAEAVAFLKAAMEVV
jgi:hypothetical protein